MGHEREAAALADNYRTIFDAANDAIFIHDVDSGAIVDVNRTMCELFGYTREEALTLTVGDISVGDGEHNESRAVDLIRRAADGTPMLFEWRCRRKNGQAFWVEVNLKPVSIGGEDRLLAVVHDISQRKEVLEALRVSEARFRRVVEDLPEFVCRFKPDTTITFVNQAYAQWFGRTPEDLLGRKFLELVPPEDHALVMEHLARVDADTPIRTIEHQAVTADGEVRWHRWRDRALLDDAGNVVEFQSIGQDISEQREAREALRESEAKLRSITLNSPDYIMLVGLDGTIQFINRTVPDLTPDEVLGRKIYRYVPDRFHGTMRGCFERVLRTGGPDGYEIEYEAADGTLRTFESRVGPVQSGGRIVAFAVSSSDVTERQRTAEALRAGKQHFQMLAQSSPSIVFRADADGQPVYVNDRWHEITGLPEGSWRDDGWSAAIHDEDRTAVTESWQKSVRSRRPWQREFRFGHADGGAVWVLAVAVPIDGEGRRGGGFIGTCTDITERRRVEDELRRTGERERLLRLELDHRVRNNLTSLLALIDMTRRTGADTKAFADAMGGRVHAMATVHSLLSHSNSGQVDVVGLCRLLRPHAPGAMRCAGDDVLVPAYRSTSLAMVLHELFTNSMKYGALGDPDGRVELVWTCEPESADSLPVSLRWRETGGPEIVDTPVPGVGTSLIEGLVRSDLMGRATLSYPRTGADHRLILTLVPFSGHQLDETE